MKTKKRRISGLFFLFATLVSANAGPILDTGSPVGFFTNAASRLLASQLNVDLARMQIYPTNQYTPAVHRLLQVAANVYEAASTNRYPSVFRPMFFNDGTNVFITGYEQVVSVTGVGDPQLALPVDVANVPVGLSTNLNVYGIPWIIGARKGFPNFNKFDMESAFQLTRRLQVTRPNTNSPPMDYQYNQMFLLSLTNQLGVDCWNSYTNDFADPVAIYVTDNQSVTLANDEGLSTNTGIMVSGTLPIPNGTTSAWPSYNPYVNPLMAPASFQIPLETSAALVPFSIYRFNAGGIPYLTGNLTLPFETNVVINGISNPQPDWWLTTSNKLRVIIMDTTVSPYRIIDYVQLNGPNSSRDLTSEILSNYDVPATSTNIIAPSGSELWSTNRLSGYPTLTIGIMSQLGVSMGNYTASVASGTWSTQDLIQRENQIDGFRAFFGYSPLYNNVGSAQAVAEAQTTNDIMAPYTPTATVVQHVSWQANDPLVHYLASDLNWQNAVVYDRTVANITNNSPNGTLGMLNQSYRPWGGNPLFGANADPNAYNLALKDPLVWRSDDWNFPTNEPLSGTWLGRVHRGTPWQTVYLKASNILDQTNASGVVIGPSTWMAWTGDTNAADAAAMAPVQDWHLASLLSYLMNTNDLQSLFSVNNAHANAWLDLFNGLTALTNSLPDSQLHHGSASQFDLLAISADSPQAATLASAIQSARFSEPGHYFHDVGDILAVPQLTEQSPFLDWNDPTQQQYGISDEAYEKIPAQLLPLLRADSIGSITPMNGQVRVQFTGYDNHVYAIEISSNLVNWVSVNTNYPVGGAFNLSIPAAKASPEFYRSVLLQ